MNIIKLILAGLGIIFGGLILLWVLGFVWSILWYLVVFGLIGGLVYGGYRLFTAAERKALGSAPHGGIGSGDINMSWDEYDKKYLHK
ncbi:MAG: hypothetical protein ACJ73D_11500 [Pyrinomonadaceae bacterium]